MAKGGARPGAGRKKLPKADVPKADRGYAGKVVEVMEKLGPPVWKTDKQTNEKTLRNPAPDPVLERIRVHWFSDDEMISHNTQKYWFDKRDGKPVQTVNHLHDKPIEMTVSVSVSEVVRKVRERREQYERSRS